MTLQQQIDHVLILDLNTITEEDLYYYAFEGEFDEVYNQQDYKGLTKNQQKQLLKFLYLVSRTIEMNQ